MKRLLRFRKTVGWAKCAYADGGSHVTYHHQVGLLFNWRAAWVGFHYSRHDRRLCVNVVPFLTVWWTKPGGWLP